MNNTEIDDLFADLKESIRKFVVCGMVTHEAQDTQNLLLLKVDAVNAAVRAKKEK